MTRLLDPARARAQLARHRSGVPTDTVTPTAPRLPVTWGWSTLGVTVKGALHGIEAGMRLLAQVEPRWRPVL